MGQHAVKELVAAGDREETRVAFSLLADRALATSPFRSADGAAREIFRLGFADMARGTTTAITLRDPALVDAYTAGGQAYLDLLRSPAMHHLQLVGA